MIDSPHEKGARGFRATTSVALEDRKSGVYFDKLKPELLFQTAGQAQIDRRQAKCAH